MVGGFPSMHAFLPSVPTGFLSQSHAMYGVGLVGLTGRPVTESVGRLTAGHAG